MNLQTSDNQVLESCYSVKLLTLEVVPVLLFVLQMYLGLMLISVKRAMIEKCNRLKKCVLMFE